MPTVQQVVFNEAANQSLAKVLVNGSATVDVCGNFATDSNGDSVANQLQVSLSKVSVIENADGDLPEGCVFHAELANSDISDITVINLTPDASLAVRDYAVSFVLEKTQDQGTQNGNWILEERNTLHVNLYIKDANGVVQSEVLDVAVLVDVDENNVYTFDEPQNLLINVEFDVFNNYVTALQNVHAGLHVKQNIEIVSNERYPNLLSGDMTNSTNNDLNKNYTLNELQAAWPGLVNVASKYVAKLELVDVTGTTRFIYNTTIYVRERFNSLSLELVNSYTDNKLNKFQYSAYLQSVSAATPELAALLNGENGLLLEVSKDGTLEASGVQLKDISYDVSLAEAGVTYSFSNLRAGSASELLFQYVSDEPSPLLTIPDVTIVGVKSKVVVSNNNIEHDGVANADASLNDDADVITWEVTFADGRNFADASAVTVKKAEFKDYTGNTIPMMEGEDYAYEASGAAMYVVRALKLGVRSSIDIVLDLVDNQGYSYTGTQAAILQGSVKNVLDSSLSQTAGSPYTWTTTEGAIGGELQGDFVMPTVASLLALSGSDELVDAGEKDRTLSLTDSPNAFNAAVRIYSVVAYNGTSNIQLFSSTNGVGPSSVTYTGTYSDADIIALAESGSITITYKTYNSSSKLSDDPSYTLTYGPEYFPAATKTPIYIVKNSNKVTDASENDVSLAPVSAVNVTSGGAYTYGSLSVDDIKSLMVADLSANGYALKNDQGVEEPLTIDMFDLKQQVITYSEVSSFSISWDVRDNAAFYATSDDQELWPEGTLTANFEGPMHDAALKSISFDGSFNNASSIYFRGSAGNYVDVNNLGNMGNLGYVVTPGELTATSTFIVSGSILEPKFNFTIGTVYFGYLTQGDINVNTYFATAGDEPINYSQSISPSIDLGATTEQIANTPTFETVTSPYAPTVNTTEYNNNTDKSVTYYLVANNLSSEQEFQASAVQDIERVPELQITASITPDSPENRGYDQTNSNYASLFYSTSVVSGGLNVTNTNATGGEIVVSDNEGASASNNVTATFNVTDGVQSASDEATVSYTWNYYVAPTVKSLTSADFWANTGDVTVDETTDLQNEADVRSQQTVTRSLESATVSDILEGGTDINDYSVSVNYAEDSITPASIGPGATATYSETVSVTITEPTGILNPSSGLDLTGPSESVTQTLNWTYEDAPAFNITWNPDTTTVSYDFWLAEPLESDVTFVQDATVNSEAGWSDSITYSGVSKSGSDYSQTASATISYNGPIINGDTSDQYATDVTRTRTYTRDADESRLVLATPSGNLALSYVDDYEAADIMSATGYLGGLNVQYWDGTRSAYVDAAPEPTLKNDTVNALFDSGDFTVAIVDGTATYSISNKTDALSNIVSTEAARKDLSGAEFKLDLSYPVDNKSVQMNFTFTSDQDIPTVTPATSLEFSYDAAGSELTLDQIFTISDGPGDIQSIVVTAQAGSYKYASYPDLTSTDLSGTELYNGSDINGATSIPTNVPGYYIVTVTVTDDHDNVNDSAATTTYTVKVIDQTANDYTLPSGDEVTQVGGNIVNFDATASGSLANASDVSVSVSGYRLVNYYSGSNTSARLQQTPVTSTAQVLSTVPAVFDLSYSVVVPSNEDKGLYTWTNADTTQTSNLSIKVVDTQLPSLVVKDNNVDVTNDASISQVTSTADLTFEVVDNGGVSTNQYAVVTQVQKLDSSSGSNVLTTVYTLADDLSSQDLVDSLNPEVITINVVNETSGTNVSELQTVELLVDGSKTGLAIELANVDLLSDNGHDLSQYVADTNASYIITVQPMNVEGKYVAMGKAEVILVASGGPTMGLGEQAAFDGAANEPAFADITDVAEAPAQVTPNAPVAPQRFSLTQFF
jgi:hypothetical protein